MYKKEEKKYSSSAPRIKINIGISKEELERQRKIEQDRKAQCKAVVTVIGESPVGDDAKN